MHSGCFSLHGVSVRSPCLGQCSAGAVLRSPLYLSAVPTCKESDMMMTPSEFGVATILNDSSLYPTMPSLLPLDEYSVSSHSAVQDILGVLWYCVCLYTPLIMFTA